MGLKSAILMTKYRSEIACAISQNFENDLSAIWLKMPAGLLSPLRRHCSLLLLHTVNSLYAGSQQGVEFHPQPRHI